MQDIMFVSDTDEEIYMLLYIICLNILWALAQGMHFESKEDTLSSSGEIRGRLNIKMSSYQCRDPHVKDKTV